MLKRIKKIEGIGSFISARAGSVELNKVNIVYGENRNGKSTLCDIFYSLATSNTELITDRQSILLGGATQIPMKVEMQFEPGHIARFNHQQWETTLPDDCQLHIFDQNFIHRNVMSGAVNNRDNSENISNFILGEQGTGLLETLKNDKAALVTTKATLKLAEAALTPHGIVDVNAYSLSTLPIENLVDLELAINASIAKQESITRDIAGVEQVKNRENLSEINATADIDDVIIQVNECLISSMEEVHAEAKVTVSAHMEHIRTPDSFKGWVAEGLNHLDENCPFCGQELNEQAILLTDSYKAAFDEAFTKYIKETKETATGLITNSLANINLDLAIQEHQQNIKTLGAYTENKVIELLVILSKQLAQDFVNMNDSVTAVVTQNTTTKTNLQKILQEKIATPYRTFDVFNFSELEQTISNFVETKQQYKNTIDAINNILTEFKEAVDADELSKSKQLENDSQKALETKKLRHTLNEKCIKYQTLKNKVDTDSVSYDNNKQALEDSQEQFLDEYFEQINYLFSNLGSRNFNISRRANRGGNKIVYDLRVTFNGQEVHRNKLNNIFSESDRRALALCIFLAKIMKLDEHDMKKAILVMDDPVTSFDNERISSILNKLYELVPSIKQLIITTHYRGMASTAMKKFSDTKGLKIVKTVNGSDFEATTEAELTATEHDDAFNEIQAFINNQTQDNKILKLRPFLETEVRHRYKRQLIGLGLTGKTDFAVCIDSLSDNEHISETIACEIHGFRNTFNPPMHILMQMNIEDSRNIAFEMFELIYQRM
jgi:wobble nucleotide-excising tRNase